MDNMNILIAMDSFKGSLTSIEAGNAVKEGILKVDPEAHVVVRPLADGGEGTVETLIAGMGGELVSVWVTGPVGKNGLSQEKILCRYGIMRSDDICSNILSEKENDSIQESSSENVKTDSPWAIIEIAGAAGLTLVPEEMRDPMYTTTYGVGEVIRDAINRGCRHFIIGIGGSATNDGGVGMLQALGVHFLDDEGNEIEYGAIGLEKLSSIDVSYMMPELAECEFNIACDVDNPLCGEKGCSATFAPQKGAGKEDISRMDKWLAHYAELAKEKSKDSDVNADYPGDGAAGGLGFAFRTFLHGKLTPGSRLIIEKMGLSDYIEKADIVITGEGCLDGQTVMGKAPIAVARLAKGYNESQVADEGSKDYNKSQDTDKRYKDYNVIHNTDEHNKINKTKKVIAFAGKLGPGVEECLEHGIDAYYAIEYGESVHSGGKESGASNVSEIPENAMRPEIASKNLADTVEKVFRRKGLFI